MSKTSYDVAVAYRIYPKLSKGKYPPPIFSKDKFKLAEFCLKSFKNSLGNLRIKLWVLLDNCPSEYEALFTQLWSPEDLVLVRFPGIGDGATLREQARILMEQTDAEIVYFAEDDYFYLPGQFPLVVDFLKQNPDADFVATHESSDFYTADLHRFHHESREFEGKKWNTCVSTTHTFLTRRKTLIESRNIFLASYGKLSPDLSKWMALTKKRVFNPVKFIWWSLSHRWFWAASIVISWYFCWRQILFGRRFMLWSPHTAMAAHMGAGVESPGVDWQKEFQNQLAGIPPKHINE
jgi:hypothetical protein